MRLTPLFFLLLSFCVAATAYPMGVDHKDGELSTHDGWPAGFHAIVNRESRIHGYLVNSTDVFFYRGGTVELNSMIESLALLKGAETKIVLHAGSGKAKSPWGTDKGGANWSVTSYCKAGFGKADSILVDVWIGDIIQLEKLNIPGGVAVGNGKEIESFIEDLKSGKPPSPENDG